MNAPWAILSGPPVVPALPEDNERKEQFAEALLRSPTDPFRAACAVFGNDTAKALQVAQHWPYDLYVLQRQADLLEQFGPDEWLPTKAAVARRIYEVGEAATDSRDRLAAYRLYAEVRGFMPKGDGNTLNLQVNNNRVMVVKDFGNDEQWETAASKHQAKLIAHSRD